MTPSDRNLKAALRARQRLESLEGIAKRAGLHATTLHRGFHRGSTFQPRYRQKITAALLEDIVVEDRAKALRWLAEEYCGAAGMVGEPLLEVHDGFWRVVHPEGCWGVNTMVPVRAGKDGLSDLIIVATKGRLFPVS